MQQPGRMTAVDLVAEVVSRNLDAPETVGTLEIQMAAVSLMHDRDGWGETALAVFCRTFLDVYNNRSYDPAANGERAVLEKLAAFEPRMVFDVGANDGGWSAMCAELLPLARIHAFEIVPQTAAKAAARIGAHGRIVLNAFGLSDAAGDVDINVFDRKDDVSSMFDYPHGKARRLACPVRRADDYIRDQGIDHIGFLKVDVEGAENLVFAGLGEFLRDDFIDVIQFEYGRINIITHYLLRDYYLELGRRNFAVGKIFPGYVEFKDYALEDEDLRGPNFLAVSRRRGDIIARLGRPG